MNISDAKRIPLNQIAEKLGGRYSHTDRKGELWYFSPFRPDEKTASFKINPATNKWHDFGLSNTFAHKQQGSGGDTIDLWCDYHFKDRRQGVKEALQGLNQLCHISSRGESLKRHQRKEKPAVQDQQPRYKILKIADRITYAGLKEELGCRRISLRVANLYLKQGYILDTETGKKYNGFLFENDKGGYEVSIPNPFKQACFKTCIGPKASTRFLIGDEVSKADVFEGFWDMLSWLEMKAVLRPQHHTYVLNSTSLVDEICEKLIAFKDAVNQVFLFLDNDEAGFQATHNIAGKLEVNDFNTCSCEHLYKGYKDLNAFFASHFKA